MTDWKKRIKCNDPKSFEIGNIWSVENNLSLITDDFAQMIKDHTFDAIACIETKGIIFGAPLAQKLNTSLIIFRKYGKIIHTDDKYSIQYKNWRNQENGIEIEKELLGEPKKLLIVDDLVYSLATFSAALSIVKKANSSVSCFLCFANLSNRTNLEGIDILSIL